MKFDQIALTVFYLRTKKMHLVMLQGNNLKNKHARVMVLVHNMSSECALQMYEFFL